MPYRSRSSRRGSGGRRGKLVWTHEAVHEVSIAAGVQSLSNILSNITDDIRMDSVVQRIIGNWWVRPAAVNQTILVKCCILTMNADQFAAGAAPELFVDDADYMFHDHFPIIAAGTNRQFDIRPIDVKSKRKMHERERQLVLQLENFASSGAAAIAGFGIRTLLKLP